MEESKVEPEVKIEPKFEEIVEDNFEMSESINELAGALAKAQGLMSAVGKGKEGYNYNYSDLASVQDASRKPLSDNGISVVQSVETLRRKAPWIACTTMILHESGQWLKSRLAMPVVQMKSVSPAQAIGATITYARRYSWQAVLGMASEDNDASIKTK
jgi:hypothetical protein